ncbi:MAG: penicillin-binding protein [Microbacteriaceae bacterium]|nr:penicillin-binding protein [Microbacteriaceae bacterium]
MSAQNSKSAGVLGALAGLVGFSALAGVLVTAMVAPALAVTSMTANSTVGIFEDLPDYVTINQQSQRNTLYGLQGGAQVPFAQVYNQNREEVPWESVSQHVKDAAIAAEDERFYEHGGVDLAGIVRAAVTNVTSDDTQGASTLSQQLVKNLLIMDALNKPTKEEQDEAYAEAQAPTLDRKLREAKLAIGLEKRYTKQEILLGYLNIAGFGGNTYGIESAAQQYYSTNAASLTPAQSASLIAIVQSPNANNPGYPENWERNQVRRDAILGNMLEQKMLTQEQYDEAIATPVNETTIVLSTPNSGCLYASAARFFCDYVVRNVPNFEALGDNEEERAENWKKGGYDVYTTIDLDQQANAEAQLAKYAPADEARFQLGAAASTVQVGTGQIRVMAQNKNYNVDASDPTGTSVNFNTDQEYGASTGFQSGSAYKLFTLVNWLQNGHGLREIVDGSPRSYTLPADCYGSKSYLFKNDRNTNPGRVDVMRATSASVNAAFANMASKLDLCDIRDTAASMGMHRADGRELQVNPTMILGTDEVAPLSVANAYATVAGGGILCQPIAVDKFVAPDGTELVGQASECSQAIAPEVAAGAATALEGVMRSGGTGARANPLDGTPLIGKTGTADAVHTFLATASMKLATAVWVGNIQGSQDLRKTTVARMNGGDLRYAIMKPILAALNASPHGVDAGEFPEAPAALVRGSSQAVPSVVGQTLAQAESLIESLGLNFRDGGTVPSELPAGRVVSTNPGTGTLVSKGTTVEVMTSDGTLAATMPDVTGKAQSAAVEALAAAGFNPASVSYQYVDGDPKTECTVTASDPAAGSAISKAATITLTVNRGAKSEGADCA